jgi:indolepyruvate ferredoxin oxidoreductase
VAQVQAAEAPLGKTSLTETVARNLAKLMAYKDEYEVARLHTQATFHDKLENMFEPGYRLNYHLAPPLLAKTNERGELVKQKFGPAMLTGFKLLAPLKALRGTAFDVFGRTAERRSERQLVADYRSTVTELLTGLNATNHALALELAQVPDAIKGFGHVKERNLRAARERWNALLTQWRNRSE